MLAHPVDGVGDEGGSGAAALEAVSRGAVLALTERAPAANGHGHPVELRDDAPIRGRQGCTRYVARVVRGIDVSAPTPSWMATRLAEAGMDTAGFAIHVPHYLAQNDYPEAVLGMLGALAGPLVEVGVTAVVALVGLGLRGVGAAQRHDAGRDGHRSSLAACSAERPSRNRSSRGPAWAA